jgi:hypothetical protein
MPDPADHDDDQPRGTSRVSLSRAIVLVVGAFLVGLLLLHADSRPLAPQLSSASGAPTSTSTPPVTTAPAHPTTTTSSTGTPTTAPAHPTTTTSSPTVHSTTTTTSVSTTSGTQPPSQVHVLVANGSGVNGAGATLTTTLEGDGWSMFAPVTASSQVATTTVYYTSNEATEAQIVAGQIKVSAGAVQPITATVPVADIGGAAVVVVLGPDLAGQAKPSTSTDSSTTVATTAS